MMRPRPPRFSRRLTIVHDTGNGVPPTVGIGVISNASVGVCPLLDAAIHFQPYITTNTSALYH
jgi:hypothetical protein